MLEQIARHGIQYRIILSSALWLKQVKYVYVFAFLALRVPQEILNMHH